MIEQDVLSQHIAALRTRSFVVSDQSATQERIVASLRARRRRKRTVLRILIGALLVLPFGSTSYALIYGVPPALRPLLSRVGLAVEAPGPHAAPRERAVDTAPAVVEPSKPSAMPAEPALGLATQPSEVTSLASRERSRDATRRQRARSAEARRPEPAQLASPAESAEVLSRQLYARAHELHFVARDREAALRAWDDYLARAPEQVLRIEAEFNRAMCLVRLGRKEDALRELAPFANGIYGSYRRRESAALMRALSR